MCSYIKASPTVISDHPRDTPLALPPPAPVQQPLGGRVRGFPEDALEINHLLIRNLEIILMGSEYIVRNNVVGQVGEKWKPTVFFLCFLQIDPSDGNCCSPGTIVFIR